MTDDRDDIDFENLPPDMRESLMTEEEALAYAQELFEVHQRWTTCRWRVDGTRTGGNSRLLGRAAADRTLTQYGGQLREMIPTLKRLNTRLARQGEK